MRGRKFPFYVGPFPFPGFHSPIYSFHNALLANRDIVLSPYQTTRGIVILRLLTPLFFF